MMPFSVLRIWGLGIFSWLVLGLGIYLSFKAYEEFPRQDLIERPVAVETRDDMAARDVDDVSARDLDQRREHAELPTVATPDWEFWALLAGAIACLGLSLGGSWPVSLLLSRTTGAAPASLQPAETLTVPRPDNCELHVEIYGEATAPTLLLTHGWSLDTSAWDYIKARLAKHYRVVAWDLPGMGKSKGPSNGNYSLQRMADDLDAVLEMTKNQAPIVLVGHSIGGMILQTYSRCHADQLDERVQGLVLLHTTYTNPLRTNVVSNVTTLLETPVIVPLNYLTIALWPLAWLSNWQSYLNGSLHCVTRFASFTGKQTRQQLDHAARLAALAYPAAVARGNLAMLKFNEEQTLESVDTPTLVIAGEHDRMTLPSASRHLEKLLPDDRPASVDGGHLGHWELADEVADAIVQFADGVIARPRQSKRLRSMVQ
jgi:pimeloyl-ACP methyl ester carboxylesterase